MSSYPSPRFFSPPSSSSSSSTTTPFQRDPYQMSYHHAHPPSVYYPFSPPFDGSVNLNNPYIYDPTHVKHRRRTTPEQLKVLEETFKTDPKPNPTLRKRLSLELGMTPRVLQVWFQNRRMKVKRLVKKQYSSTDQALAESTSNDTVDEQQSESPSSSTIAAASHSTAMATGSVVSTASASASATSPPVSSGSSSSTPAPSPASPSPYPDITLRRSSLPLAVGHNSSPNHVSSHGFYQQQQHQPVNQYQHHGMPWNTSDDDYNTSENPIVPHNIPSNFSVGGNDMTFDPLTDPLLLRRRSFTSLHRLDSHPFALLVAAGNGVAISPQTRRSQPPFLSSLELTSASSENSKPRLNTGTCSSPSNPLSADNSSNMSTAVSFLPSPLISQKAAGVPSETSENVFSTSDLDGLNNQNSIHKHHENSHKLSPANGTKNLQSEAVADPDLDARNNLERLGSTETALRSIESEGLQRQPAALTTPVENQLAAAVQQMPSFLQRSQSTLQTRPFITHHHSSSTPPHIFTQKAPQLQTYNSPNIPNNIPPRATHFTHLHASTMGVVQPGFRSASFHGIIPSSDNYQAYYNRQILAGQNLPAVRSRNRDVRKRLSAGNEQQSLSATVGRRLHPTLSTLHQQFSDTQNCDYMHITSRSIPLLDYTTSDNDAEISGQASQSHQHPEHYSLPPQSQSEIGIPTTHPPYAFPPRPLGALPPGPLPAADYSFGTATSSTDADNEVFGKQNEMREDNQHNIPWNHSELSIDTMCNTTESSFNTNGGHETRFGSVTSLMSMPSVPSASEGGATAEWEWDWESEGLRDGRRGSCTGHVAELFSNLDVGSRRGSEESIHSTHSMNISVGMSGHDIHLRDPNETRELSYRVPNIDKTAANHANEYPNKKKDENEQEDEDQRKTPSARPGEASKNQSQNVIISDGKNPHADEVTSAYLPIHPQSIYYPLSHLCNTGIGIEYASGEFEVARDVVAHNSTALGSNFNMSLDLGGQFQYQDVNVDYVSQGTDRFLTNADDNMLGVERYTGMTDGSYDEIY